jgi:ATP-dependent Zn protease
MAKAANPALKFGLPEYIIRKEIIWIASCFLWFHWCLSVDCGSSFLRKMGGGVGGPGGQIFNIGKSKATLVDKGQNVNITFDDVAGLDEAKGEVMEIVDFLKNPKKCTKLGGKMPKGALSIGPPVTGKNPDRQSHGRRGTSAILQHLRF